jgi:hypothetical protein
MPNVRSYVRLSPGSRQPDAPPTVTPDAWGQAHDHEAGYPAAKHPDGLRPSHNRKAKALPPRRSAAETSQVATGLSSTEGALLVSPPCPDSLNPGSAGAVFVDTANGIRTRVTAVRGRRPSPLDDGGALKLDRG